MHCKPRANVSSLQGPGRQAACCLCGGLQVDEQDSCCVGNTVPHAHAASAGWFPYVLWRFQQCMYGRTRGCPPT